MLDSETLGSFNDQELKNQMNGCMFSFVKDQCFFISQVFSILFDGPKPKFKIKKIINKKKNKVELKTNQQQQNNSKKEKNGQ